MKKIVYLIAIVFLCVACTTSRTNVAQKLRPVTVEGKSKCEFIALVTEGAGGRGTIARNTESAMNEALNRVGESGGDSYYFISSQTTTMGSSVILESYRCNK